MFFLRSLLTYLLNRLFIFLARIFKYIYNLKYLLIYKSIVFHCEMNNVTASSNSFNYYRVCKTLIYSMVWGYDNQSRTNVKMTSFYFCHKGVLIQPNFEMISKERTMAWVNVVNDYNLLIIVAAPPLVTKFWIEGFTAIAGSS